MNRFALPRMIALALVGAFAGCAHWPATPALEKAGAPGYRLNETSRPGQSDELLVIWLHGVSQKSI